MLQGEIVWLFLAIEIDSHSKSFYIIIIFNNALSYLHSHFLKQYNFTKILKSFLNYKNDLIKS